MGSCRNRLIAAGIIAGLNCVALPFARAAELAFPSAEGFGALATGGRNGEIVRVTNLEDSGPGSFREAVSKPNRFIVFDVGGVIRLKANVALASHITLAGHSAPGDGIAFYGKSVSFSGSSNVIVRYLRFRQGINGDRGKCSINISRGSNMIFDHCSIQWGRWDSLGVTQGSRDITLQHCIIGEAIDPQRFGALVDSVTNVTLHHNLWINNQSRNPKAKGQIQYHNNVVYNWGGTGLVGGHSAADRQLDAIGNYFIKGPSSNDRFAGQFAATDHVFQRGNYADLDRDGKLNGRLVEPSDFGHGKDAPTFTAKPFLAPSVTVHLETAEAAFHKVMKTAGASLQRDSVDARLIAELISLGELGRISHNEDEAGGLGGLESGRPAVDSTKFSTAAELELALSRLLGE
jgi:pectate lyase